MSNPNAWMYFSKETIQTILSRSVKKDLMNFEHRWNLKSWIDESILSKGHIYSYIALNPNAMYLIECLKKTEPYKIQLGIIMFKSISNVFVRRFN